MSNENLTGVDLETADQLGENGLPSGLREWVTEKEGGNYNLRLAYPVKHGEKLIESIDGRRPCGRHVRDAALSAPKTGDWLDLFARSSGTPTTIIDQMDIADCMRVVILMGFFMGGGQATGLT